MRFFRENNVVEIEFSEELVEDGIEIQTNPKTGLFDLEKVVTVDGLSYTIRLYNAADMEPGQAMLDFGVSDSIGNPVTNKGLEAFGQLVDHMQSVFQKAKEKCGASSILIYAAKTGYSLEADSKLLQTITGQTETLNGFAYVNSEMGIEYSAEDGILTVVEKGVLGRKKISKVPISVSLFNDLNFVHQIHDPTLKERLLQFLGVANDNKEKEVQRLKLYYFYLKKRFPEYSYNVEEKKVEGKREIVFEKDETGEYFIEVRTEGKKIQDRTYSAGY